MHLVILMAQTDESEFAQRHPKDGEKFTTLIHSVRPDWTTEVFSVKDGVFPESLDGFDGVIVTGSLASVNDELPWVARLDALLRAVLADGTPLFGACFGHQAIAKAMGVPVIENPQGLVFGATKTRVVERPAWAEGLPDELPVYTAHSEQVAELPPGARVLLSTEGCPVAGFEIGGRVMTTQYHPEITPGFIEALIEEYGPGFPPEVEAAARETTREPVDGRAYAEALARFFEQAARAQ